MKVSPLRFGTTLSVAPLQQKSDILQEKMSFLSVFRNMHKKRSYSQKQTQKSKTRYVRDYAFETI